MYDAFRAYTFGWDDEAVYLMYDEDDDEEGYSIHVLKIYNNSMYEDLDLDPVDENQIDDKIKEVIQRFLLDMGEYCVTIGDTVFEGNPSGIRNSEGRYEPCRDAAFKVHNGEVTFLYPDDMQNNQEEVAEWNRIESAAVNDKATDPSDYLKNYHESNTVSYEQAIYDLGYLWGYSKEEIEDDLISQI